MKAEDIGVLFDEVDRPVVEAHEWWLNTQGYACTKVNRRTKGMHRMILGDIPAGMVVDHINRNPLDNRRSNLRICSYSTNRKNSKNVRGASSRHRGVSKVRGKWQVVVRINGRLKWIGMYATEAEAAAVAAPYFDNAEHQPLKFGLGPSGPQPR